MFDEYRGRLTVVSGMDQCIYGPVETIRRHSSVHGPVGNDCSTAIALAMTHIWARKRWTYVACLAKEQPRVLVLREVGGAWWWLWECVVLSKEECVASGLAPDEAAARVAGYSRDLRNPSGHIH